MKDLYTLVMLANKQADDNTCPVCACPLEFVGYIADENGKTWDFFSCKCPTPKAKEGKERGV